MSPNQTDSQLGPTLLTMRGFQWVYGVKDDPYGLLLRAEGADPHVLGQRVRDRGPLSLSSADVLVTASHEAATAILRDPRFDVRPPELPSTDPPNDWQLPALSDVLPLDDAFLNLNRADYQGLRQVIDAALRPGWTDRHGTEVARICAQVIGRLGGEFDLMTDFARRCAVAAVAALLGVPTEHHEHYARLSAGAATALDATLCPPHLNTARTLITSVAALRDLLAELVESRVRTPGEDLISHVLRTCDDDSPAPDNALAIAMLHSIAGVETTTNLICNTMTAMLDHPHQWDLLRQEPALATDAVEETLRYAPPIRLQRLVAQCGFAVAGIDITPNDEVVVLIEAANRDPDAYPDPDRYDIRRETPTPHLTLAHDLAADVIAPVTRLHASAAVAAIARQLPDIRRNGTALRRLRSPVCGGTLQWPARKL